MLHKVFGVGCLIASGMFALGTFRTVKGGHPKAAKRGMGTLMVVFAVVGYSLISY